MTNTTANNIQQQIHTLQQQLQQISNNITQPQTQQSVGLSVTL